MQWVEIQCSALPTEWSPPPCPVIFPEYFLEGDDEYGASRVREEDAESREKRSKQARRRHRRSEREREEHLCAICLDSIDFDTQSVVKYCHQGHYLHCYCAIPWVERTRNPLPCCVCRGPPRSKVGVILDTCWTTAHYFQLCGYRMHNNGGQLIGPPDPTPWDGKYVVYCCRDTRWPRPMRRIVAFNRQRGVQCPTCRTFLSVDHPRFQDLGHVLGICPVHGRMTRRASWLDFVDGTPFCWTCISIDGYPVEECDATFSRIWMPPSGATPIMLSSRINRSC